MTTENYSELPDAQNKARDAISYGGQKFSTTWENNPSTAVRVILGYWIHMATRHLGAMVILSCNGDLSRVSCLHYRQLLEIFLQTRHFLLINESDRDYTAQKISAIGVIDLLNKWEPIKESTLIKPSYNELKAKLNTYDEEVVNDIYKSRENREYKWFKKSYSQLAKDVSKKGQDLKSTYGLVSGETHGSYGVALDVKSTSPGHLEFRGYDDKTTLDKRAATELNNATDLFLVLLEEIFEDVGVIT